MSAPTTIDPRVLADALEMDTYTLSEQFVVWCSDAMPSIRFSEGDIFGPIPLDEFDESVAKARRHLTAAHEAMAAFLADNPEFASAGGETPA